MNYKLKKIVSSILAVVIAVFPAANAFACTRVLHNDSHGNFVTGRTMDWKEEIQTNLWAFPAGMKRIGGEGKDPIHWTSKYGSVIASAYDIATSDGVNEKGLSANILWLAESQYPVVKEGEKTLTISMWAQYVLDNFATVDEAVKALEKKPFVLVTAEVPGQSRDATVHLSMSDKSGDSAIIEYIDGKQVIHHSKSYEVMTNSPEFSQQISLNDYWKGIGGNVFLPGTNRAADRFVRASYYNSVIDNTTDLNKTVASVFGIMKNVSVPYGIKSLTDEVNISSTRWTTVCDHTRGLYFFQSSVMPNVFWVDINKIDLSDKTGKVLKLDLGKEQSNVFAGEVSGKFVESKMMNFL